MFEKDLMQGLSDEFNNLSEAEKDKRVKGMQQLLDEELKRRKSGGGPNAAGKKAAGKKKGFWHWVTHAFKD